MPTAPSQFRLGQSTIADLDMIAAYLQSQGQTGTRSDAVRVAARAYAQRLRRAEKNLRKKSP